MPPKRPVNEGSVHWFSIEPELHSPVLDSRLSAADEADVVPFAVEVGMSSQQGSARAANEDHCGHHRVDASTILVVVADGVSKSGAGGTASEMAVDITLRAFREQDSRTAIELRLARAVQQANIEIYDLGVAVPELRGMATTLTAVIVSRGRMFAAHIGDTRLYLVRGDKALQLTKDHIARKAVLTRVVGPELIVAIDRLSRPLEQDDVLVICTDGLYGVLTDGDVAALSGGAAPDEASGALVAGAVARQTRDDATAAVIRVVGPDPDAHANRSVPARLLRLLRPR